MDPTMKKQFLYPMLMILIYVVQEWIDTRATTLYRQPYTSTPIMTYTNAILNPDRFKRMTNFNVGLFYQKLIAPLTPFVEQPRRLLQSSNYLNNSVADFDPRTTRGCVLSTANRILRWALIYKGEKNWALIESLFDQARSTAFRDFIHISIANLHANSNRYLKPFNPGSQEFEQAKGAGILKHFSSAIGIGDVTKIRCRAPRGFGHYHKDFRDGHHFEYNVGWLLIVDGFGMARLASGWLPGASNDINIWRASKFYRNQEEYFGDGKILFDGIFRYVPGPWICSFRKPRSEKELLFNLLHILTRALIEHVIGRQKHYWGIIGTTYSLHLRWLGLIYRNVMLLTNILIEHQSPMR